MEEFSEEDYAFARRVAEAILYFKQHREKVKTGSHAEFFLKLLDEK